LKYIFQQNLGKKTQGVGIILVTHYYFGNLYFNSDLNFDKYLLLSANLAPKSRDYCTQHISVALSYSNFEVILSTVYCCKGCTREKAS